MKIDQKENLCNTMITHFMPTKAQIESTTLALRKAVARYNKAQLKLNKADQASQKARKKPHGMISLRSVVNRWNKAKREFERAEKNWVDKAKKYRAIHSKLPHGHWMAD